MRSFKKVLTAAAAVIVCSNLCFGYGSNQSLIGNISSVNAADYSDIIQYDDFISYCKIDKDSDGTYDLIEIAGCEESAVSVEIPAEIEGLPVNIITYSAFADCTDLTSIKIPDSVFVIRDNAFTNCTNLRDIKIPNDVSVIADETFYGCTSLTSIEIPDSVIHIGQSAFKDCIGLTSIKMPDRLVNIQYNAFQNCTGLTSIEIPDSVIRIGHSAFEGCTGLTSIKIPDNAAYIDKNIFEDTPFIKNQTGIKYVGKWVVDCDKDITKAEIKSGTKGIAREAFYKCTGLTSVEIPDGITEIGDHAFNGCTGLTSIEIPDSITSIGSNAFSDTPFIKNQTGIKYAGKWVVECDYDITTAEIRSGTKGIANYAFIYCENLTGIKIPDGITEIGDYAFHDCTGLTSIEIPDSVTSIGYDAFYGTSILKNQTGVKYADKWVVGCDSSVEKINIKSGTKGIAQGAFFWSGDYTSVEIPDSVISIGMGAFLLCDHLTHMEIPDSVTSIGMGAFLGCVGLTSVTIKNPECEIEGGPGTICNFDINGKPNDVVIRGYNNSTAQTFAEKYNYKFESLGEKPQLFLRGDISGNGEIDLQDAIQIARYILGTIKFTDEEMNIADYNNDGEVDIQDVIGIARYILNTVK